MCSVLWALVVLLGSIQLEPALLGPSPHQKAGPHGWQDRLKGLKDYQVVVPQRVDRSGQPYPDDECFLPKKRSRRSAEGPGQAQGDNPYKTEPYSILDDDDSFADSRQMEISDDDVDAVLSPDGSRTSPPGDHTSPGEGRYYTLEAFGEKFDLELEEFTDFIAPTLLVEYQDTNESQVYADSDLHKHCFHRGKVRGDPQSAVSLSVCHSLMGTIQAFNHRYMIEPHIEHAQEVDTDDVRAKPHLMYRLEDTAHFRKKSHSCALDDKISDVRQGKQTRDETAGRRRDGSEIHGEKHHRHRGKRSVSVMSERRWVEVMVVADQKMSRYHGEDINHYLLTVMATVASIYRDPSIGNLINIVLTKIMIVKDHMELRVSQNAVATLRDFCRWQEKQNTPDDNHVGHFDTAVLLTRVDICRSVSECDTLGLAELGTICNPAKSCSIIEDNGLSAAFTVAHEIGHVFNLPHDDDTLKCNVTKSSDKENDYHVMAPTLDYNTNPWNWSDCSRRMLTEFLDGDVENGQCLLDKPQEAKHIPRMLGKNTYHPGELYPVDKQCEQVFGKGYRRCPFMSDCERLWCTTNSSSVGCRTQHMPWADGTACGDNHSKKDMWCQQKRCVPRKRVAPRAGGWGRWGHYGECSRTCGGGIKKKKRECNNPPPSNGGSFCKGRRVKYKSCNTKDCDKSSDFRKDQCEKFNGQHFNIYGLNQHTRWVPKYEGIAKNKRCKLFCQVEGKTAFYQLNQKVIDGTKCGPDTSDVCVNGRCHEAGCDNRLNSNKTRDVCGVCGGDGTNCQLIRKSFNGPVSYGYNTIDKIPAGASHIDIRQTGSSWGEDENYLALRDDELNLSILNGLVQDNFVVSKFRKDIKLNGTTIQYSGSNQRVEHINITKPLEQNLTLLVLSVGELNDPNIDYQYYIPKPYTWVLRSRGMCECNGFRISHTSCIRKDTRMQVDDAYCRDIPNPYSRSCTPSPHKCRYSWEEKKSSCGADCMQTIDYVCTRERREVDEVYCRRKQKPRAKKERCKSCHVFSRLVRHHDNKPHPRPSWYYKEEWSKCSKSCGGGYQKRSALCLNHKNEKVPPDNCLKYEALVTRPCNEELCPVWKAHDWSECSVTCGSGWKHRPVFCRQGNKYISKMDCNRDEEPDTKMKCSTGPCPQWSSGNWGPCSVTCGTGAHHRAVRCRAADGSFLEEAACNVALRPPHKLTCTQAPCTTTTSYKTTLTTTTQSSTAQSQAPTYTPVLKSVPSGRRPQWRTGSWTDCSVTCGTGTRERYVSCRDHDGNISEDSGCAGRPKPPSKEECTLTACGEWRIGKWTSCSRSCGEGIQTRLVACVLMDELDEQIASNKMCNLAIKPPNERFCNNSQECVPIKKFPISSISTNSVIGTAHWRAGPWGSCSTTCSHGWQRRKVVCQDENGSSNNCDPDTKPDDLKACHPGPCPRWNYGNWGQCSKSCGGGHQRRVVLCQLPNGQTMPDNSCSMRDKPPDRQSCGTEKCTDKPHWHKTPWSTCSASCGRGRKTRAVTCVDKDGTPVSDSRCRHRRPRTVKRCRTGRCPRWEAFEWGKCSATCGSGVRERRVKCIRNKGRTVDPKNCESSPPPPSTEVCQVRKCLPYYWQTGRWSQCSHTCGYGMMYRKVMCMQMSTGKVVDEGYCRKEDKPRGKKQCNQSPCEFIWETGDFSKCSAECGMGVMRRNITCRPVSAEGWVLPEVAKDGCDVTDRPDVTLPCNNGYCDSQFRWHVTEWGECSKSCGYGKARRKVQCIDADKNKHHPRNCPEPYKPEHIKLCYNKPCYASTCRELKHLSAIQRDGEYDLDIHGKLLPIYCSGMNTSHPKEFLTLKSNERENYSEVFKKRLRRAATCPAGDPRSPSCPDCLRARDFSRAGLTNFHKIRLNITSSHLSIINNDFTYCSSHGAKKIPYGSAGDCYSSSLKCPQGLFRIDLTGTGFRVAQGQQWHSYGLRISTNITVSQDGQVVEGRCGGFCGGCKPPTEGGLRLHLLP